MVPAPDGRDAGAGGLLSGISAAADGARGDADGHRAADSALICADKSNAQIGEIMDIKLPTVKTHVSHILEKLGVSRRSEARTVAQKRWLV